MSWPEYLQGYAGLGILQTLSNLIRAARVVGGKQMHLSIEGRKQEEGGLHRGDKFKGNAVYLPAKVSWTANRLAWLPFSSTNKHHTV